MRTLKLELSKGQSLLDTPLEEISDKIHFVKTDLQPSLLCIQDRCNELKDEVSAIEEKCERDAKAKTRYENEIEEAAEMICEARDILCKMKLFLANLKETHSKKFVNEGGDTESANAQMIERMKLELKQMETKHAHELEIRDKEIAGRHKDMEMKFAQENKRWS